MKVLVISYMYPNMRRPNSGIFIQERLENLSQLCEVKLINPCPWIPPIGSLKKLIMPNIQKENSIEIYRPKYLPLPGRIFNFIKGIWCFIFIKNEVKELYKKFNFDIIHAHRVFPEGVAAVLLGGVHKKPVVITLHGSDINYWAKSYFIRKMIIFSLDKADKIIAVSKALKSQILEMGIADGKIEVLFNAVDTNKFKPLNKIDARKKLGLPVGKKIIIFVGNLVMVKSPLFLLESIHQIREKGKDDFLLVMIGDGVLKDEIENKINKFSLQVVIKLVGAKPHEEIPFWMSAADFLVLPSINEGMPTVLLEAMACGLPVIATEVGGVSEIVDNEKTGILIQSNDAEALGKNILRLIDDEKLRERLKLNGLLFIKENNLTWQDEAFKTLGIYKRILGHA